MAKIKLRELFIDTFENSFNKARFFRLANKRCNATFSKNQHAFLLTSRKTTMYRTTEKQKKRLDRMKQCTCMYKSLTLEQKSALKRYYLVEDTRFNQQNLRFHDMFMSDCLSFKLEKVVKNVLGAKLKIENIKVRGDLIVFEVSITREETKYKVDKPYFVYGSTYIVFYPRFNRQFYGKVISFRYQNDTSLTRLIVSRRKLREKLNLEISDKDIEKAQELNNVLVLLRKLKDKEIRQYTVKKVNNETYIKDQKTKKTYKLTDTRANLIECKAMRIRKIDAKANNFSLTIKNAEMFNSSKDCIKVRMWDDDYRPNCVYLFLDNYFYNCGTGYPQWIWTNWAVQCERNDEDVIIPYWKVIRGKAYSIIYTDKEYDECNRCYNATNIYLIEAMLEDKDKTTIAPYHENTQGAFNTDYSIYNLL